MNPLQTFILSGYLATIVSLSIRFTRSDTSITASAMHQDGTGTLFATNPGTHHRYPPEMG